MDALTPLILTLNEGSSSIKFALFAADDDVPEIASGSTEAGLEAAALFDRVDTARAGRPLAAVGHRIVHGGPTLAAPLLIDAAMLDQLRAATAFAPLHDPAALALIAAAGVRYPGVPQVACFDTGFHAGLPEMAAVLPVPRAMRAEGIRRYGFHGLSCQSILRQLGDDMPEKLVIAHLGNGASVTAVRAGRSVDTSMGLTPSGGVIMGTRAGDLDPGFLLYLMRVHGMDAAAIEQLIDRQSGMRGISGVSGDVRALRGSTEPDASLALAMFCRSVAKQIAGMAVTLGGVDLLAFTGGIGEHDAGIRDRITAELAGAGLPVGGVAVLPSRENAEIARAALDVLATR
ncbi:MAG: acetate kinase [Sphingomonas sp.]|jgi:acetate kinase|uniref:acetate/propionate family kinase n=1 Tax=Sphingomonas sp. TaxID=28214 RepID=UPI00356B02B3